METTVTMSMKEYQELVEAKDKSEELIADMVNVVKDHVKSNDELRDKLRKLANENCDLNDYKRYYETAKKQNAELSDLLTEANVSIEDMARTNNSLVKCNINLQSQVADLKVKADKWDKWESEIKKWSEAIGLSPS